MFPEGEKVKSTPGKGEERGVNSLDELLLSGAVCYAEGKDRRKRERKEARTLRLGARPFVAASNLYLESREGLIAPSTLAEERKKLKFIGKMLDELKKEGVIKTTDPRHIGRVDIQGFFGEMKRRGLSPTTQKKYVQILNGLMKYWDNFTISKLTAEGYKMPRESVKEIRSMTMEDVDELISALSKPRRWDEAMMLGVVALGLSTGCRPKELRLAHIEDLDLKKKRFFVRHPKGECSWASPQWVRIVRDDMIPHLERYLDLRRRRIEGRTDINALFPALGGKNKTGFYSLSMFNRMKRDIEERTGCEFRIKDLRPTLAGQTVDMDPALLNAVSSQLRHSDVKTTQKYYAAIKDGRAGDELREAWNKKNTIPPKSPLLAKDFPMSGYA